MSTFPEIVTFISAVIKSGTNTNRYMQPTERVHQPI